MELKNIVEALIFASPEPITAKALARCVRNKIDDDQRAAEEAAEEGAPPAELDLDPSILKAKAEDIESAIADLNAAYEDEGRTFRLVDGPSGWRMYTETEYAEWVRELFPGQKPAKLSPPALETLAIIAYRQPIIKADIEAVRGVSVDGVLQKIIDRGLVKLVGRAEVPGRPLLYGTTELFMEHFGVKEIDDLPNAAELRTIPLPNADGGEQNPKETEKQMALAASNQKEDEEAARKELSGETPAEPDATLEPEPEPAAAEVEAEADYGDGDGDGDDASLETDDAAAETETQGELIPNA